MTIQDQITQAAQAAGVPSQLALNIASRESGFNNSAVGAAGEIGIFQIMPSTAAQLGIDPTNPTQNIAGGVAYIAQMLSMFGGDVQKAAAAYNCGPGCVQNAVAGGGDDTITINGVTMPAWLAGVPASTQAYVAAVTGSLAAAPGTSAPAGTTYAGGAAQTTPGTAGAPAPFDWTPFAWAGGAVLAFLTLTSIVSD